MATSLLAQVRNVARKAAKAGTGWHIQSGGAIACKDKRCTLGAILFKHYEPARKIQEEFNELIKKAESVAKGNISLNFSSEDQVFDDYIPSDDKFPDPSEVANILDMEDELTCLVVEANDNSRRALEQRVKDARQSVEENREWYPTKRYTLADDADYQEAQRVLKARIILEEELLGKK